MMKKVQEFIQKYHMIQEKDVVVTGVSGGADSVCLLFALLELKQTLDFQIVACHVNHQLRGESADADEAFVRQLCREKGVPLRVFRENVELIAAKRKQSLEEAGRTVRREAFWKVCQEVGGTKIATAHHRNDNAETMLMNLARGSGLKGMRGICPVNEIFIRPLLCLERAEIEQWLAGQRLSFCTDETNDEDAYTRNRIRHKIIPELEKGVNARAVRHICEASAQIQEVWEYLEEQTERAYCDCIRRQEEGILICKEKWEALSAVIQKLLVKKVMERTADSCRDITSVHIEAVQDLLAGQVGRQIDLPYHITARRVYPGVLIRQKKSGKDNTGTKAYKKELCIPGETEIAERRLKVSCRIFRKEADFSFSSIPQKGYTKWFDYAIIKNRLLIRTREPGDRIAIDKKGSTQKLKKYLINEKIPEEKRGTLLFIADGQQVIWIPGMRQSQVYQVTEETKQILEIKITEEKADVRDNSSINI